MMRVPGIIAALLCAALAGCASAPKEKFYVLSASAPLEPTQMVASMPNIRIVVGPVTLTEIVDRPQLVTRVAPNQVAILEQQRWAESLKIQIPRVVAENLSALLGTHHVSTYAQSGASDADYRVALEVQRFESRLNEAITIEALWAIHRGTGEKPISGHSLVREPAASPDYDGLVTAHSRALGGISHDIAEAIRAASAVPR